MSLNQLLRDTQVARTGVTVDFPEGIRSRKVVSRSRARPTGKYPSWKLGRMVQWESIHELNAFRLLDGDPSVSVFSEQPLVIRYQLDGESRTHYPDVLVTWGSGREVWEIKTATEASAQEVRKRTLILEEALPAHGYTYRLVVAEDLASEPRLTNTLTLLRFGRAPASLVDRERARQIIEATGYITWGAVLAGTLGRTGRQLICRLVLEGVLAFDVNQALTLQTRFSFKAESALMPLTMED